MQKRSIDSCMIPGIKVHINHHSFQSIHKKPHESLLLIKTIWVAWVIHGKCGAHRGRSAPKLLRVGRGDRSLELLRDSGQNGIARDN